MVSGVHQDEDEGWRLRMNSGAAGWFVALLVAIGGIVFGVIRARTDWFSGSAARRSEERDERAEVIAVKDDMIAALKESNEEYREAGREWASERTELKARLNQVEKSLNDMMVAVTKSAICARAPGCINYLPPGEQIDPIGQGAPA